MTKFEMFHFINLVTLLLFLFRSGFVCSQTNTFEDDIFEHFERKNAERFERFLQEIQKIKYLENKVQSLESEVKEMRHLEAEVKHLKLEAGSINHLKSENQYLRQENKGLRKELSKMNQTKQEAFSYNENMGTLVKNSKKKRLIGSDIIPQLTTSATAFSVVLTSKFDKNIGQLHVFVYDHIECNFGGAYSNVTGSFTAPKPGVYAFLWTITAEGPGGNHGEVGTELLVNAKIRGRAWTDTEVDNDDDQAVGFVIVQLNQGDVVFVRSSNTWGIQGTFQGYHRGGWTFSGWQIA